MSPGAKFKILEKPPFSRLTFASWKIFLSSYAGLLLSIVCNRQGSSLLLSYTKFSASMLGITSMFWSRCRCCDILCPRLGERICQWQRRRVAWSYTSPFRQIRQIPNGCPEPFCRWQQRFYILLYFNQPPSVHTYFGCSTPIRILSCSYRYVSGAFEQIACSRNWRLSTALSQFQFLVLIDFTIPWPTFLE